MNGMIPLLAADWADLLPIVVAILFIVLPAIGQLIARGRQAQQQQRPGPPPGGRPQQEPLQDEIGEFLRRAAQNRGRREPPRQAAQGGRQAPPPRPVQAQARPRQQPRPGRVRRAAAERPVQAEVVEARPMDPERLVRQINQDLNTSRFQRHARELGEEVVHAESHFDEHLHSVFDHQLGRLGEGSAPKPGEAGIPATAAVGLAAMLADAQSLRQAIVLSEILSRPEHRWE